MNFAQTKAEFRRRFILTLLAESPDYTMSDKLLRAAFVPTDFQASQVAGDLLFLQDADLVSLKEISDATETLIFARLTARGMDVATFKAAAAGVSRMDIGA